jgi:hypothetical protein
MCTWQFGKVDLAKLATQLGNFADQTLVTDMASFILHSKPIVLKHQTKCSMQWETKGTMGIKFFKAWE